jgi:ClpP class serine protease
MNNGEIWAISESGGVALKQMMAAGSLGVSSESEYSLLQMAGRDIALIDISGMTVNNSEYFGAVSYTSIINSYLEGYNQGAKVAVFNVNSPGGQTSGLFNALQTLKELQAQLQYPIIGYTGSNALSAGYALLTAGSKVYAGVGATVGSVGVLARLETDYKSLESAGVEVYYLRSGKLKANYQSDAPITEEIKSRLQVKVDKLFNMFKQHVITSRSNMLMPDPNFFEGEEYFSSEALAFGAIDGILTLPTLLASLQAQLKN